MARIATVDMRNKEGGTVTVNANDTFLQEKLREFGYEIEPEAEEAPPAKEPEKTPEEAHDQAAGEVETVPRPSKSKKSK